MSLNRYAKRRDANEAPIVTGLRRAGASVLQLDKFDLLVGFRGADYKLEVKVEGEKMKPHQRDFADNWQGSPTHEVHNLREALAVLLNPEAA